MLVLEKNIPWYHSIFKLCTLVSESWKTKIGRVALHKVMKKNLGGLFITLFFSLYGWLPTIYFEF